MVYFFCKNNHLKENYKIKVCTYNDQVLRSIKKLSNESVLSLDTETTGLNPRNNEVIMLQIGTINGDQYVYDFRDFDSNIFKSLLNDENKTFIGHNIKFDYNMLKQYDIVLKHVYDTMLSEIIINNGKYNKSVIKKLKRFSLKTVFEIYSGEKVLKEIRDEFSYIKNNSFKEEHILYGAKDVESVLKIYEKQKPIIDKYNLNKCVDLENEVTLALGDIEYNGMLLDKNKWMKAYDIFKERAKNTEIKMDSIVNNLTNKYKTPAFQINIFNEVNKKETIINWNSDIQVYKVLTDVFKIFPKDKNGNPSSSAKTIKMMNESHEILDLILKYREERKAISSFGKNFIEDFVEKDGRIHTSFNQIVETGRVSSNNPNIQQIPGGDDKDLDKNLFRESFIAGNGNKIITADYSQQESRIMADKAKDERYLNFFNNDGGDSHSFVGTQLFSAAYNKEFIVDKSPEKKSYRQKAKVLNFSISYGGTAFTLSKTLKIPEEEAQSLIDSFFKGFPKLKEMFENYSEFAIKNGYVILDDVTNRRRWFSEYDRFLYLLSKDIDATKEERKELFILKNRIKRKAQNSPIQGTAGSMTKQALVNIRNYLINDLNILPTKDAEVKIINVVHDEICMECPEEISKSIAKMQKRCMEESAKIFVKGTLVKAEPVISDYWTH